MIDFQLAFDSNEDLSDFRADDLQHWVHGVSIAQEVFCIPCICRGVPHIDCRHMCARMVVQLDNAFQYRTPQSKSCSEMKKGTPLCTRSPKATTPLCSRMKAVMENLRRSSASRECIQFNTCASWINAVASVFFTFVVINSVVASFSFLNTPSTSVGFQLRSAEKTR